MQAYKIFDLGYKNGKPIPKTLFHGNNGSRSLPVNQWIIANRKLVTDGSSQNPYLSGFHAYPSLDAVKRWLRGAKNLDDRVVVKVHVKGLRDKTHAVRKTILANKLKITAQAWARRKDVRAVL